MLGRSIYHSYTQYSHKVYAGTFKFNLIQKKSIITEMDDLQEEEKIDKGRQKHNIHLSSVFDQQ